MVDQEHKLSVAAAVESAKIAPPASKPRLGQLMLVIAALALGIVGIRNCDTQMRAIQIDRRNLVNWFVLPSPLLMSLATALVIAGLLPPRSKLSNLCRRPGFTACWVTTLVVLNDAVVMFAMNPKSLTSFDRFMRCFDFGFFWPTTGRIGFGVLIAWLTLAFTGNWQPETSWIDRSGRALGVVWLIAYLADRFAWLLWLP